MDRAIRLLLKTCDAAYKAGDKGALRAARNKLKAGIRVAKYNYRLKIENGFSDNHNTLLHCVL